MDTNKMMHEELSDFPVLRRKLTNFCVDYSLHDKPALVWQCTPLEPGEIHLGSNDLSATLAEGAGVDRSQNGWWYGFRLAQAPVPVFDGLKAHKMVDDLRWMTEVHSDGSVIAGLWSFPSVASHEGNQLVIYDFHEEAFADFASLASRLFATAAIAYPALVTCTLLNAHILRFHRKGWRHPIEGPRRKTLQWRVRKANSREQVAPILKLMAAELPRAFGQLTLS